MVLRGKRLRFQMLLKAEAFIERTAVKLDAIKPFSYIHL
jgi:hypothetical protein